MIIDQLSNAASYVEINKRLAAAFDYLRRTDLSKVEPGTYEIDGRKVYVMVQQYDTKTREKGRWEAHRKYIDVQYIASGEEVIGWAPAPLMAVMRAYDADKDIAFGTVQQGKWTAVHLGAGMLAVLWPEDAHAPKLAAGAPSAVMKIVVKVAV
jgi:YhcH/YjgK/YiaL family protein